MVDGLEIKSHTTFKGHNGETLSQGNIYFSGKKIGFISEDAWNGETQLDIDKGCEDAYKMLESRILVLGLYWTFTSGEEYKLTALDYLTEVIQMVVIYMDVKKISNKKTTVYNTKIKSYSTCNAPYTGEHIKKIDGLLEEGDIVLDVLL